MLDRDLYRRKRYEVPARRHPFALALGAVVGGVSLGAFVAIQWMEEPASPPAERAAATTAAPSATPASATPSQIQPSRTAETTGLGSTEDPRSTPRCERQTWPYQSRDCLVRVAPRVRVIPTEKVDAATIHAIEGPAAASEKSAGAATEEKPTDAAAAGGIAAVGTTGSAASSNDQAAATARGQNESSKETVGSDHRDLATNRSKSKRSRIAKERRKNEQQVQPAQTEVREGDDGPPVRQWSRHQYDVPADDGFGRRRVYVIRREQVEPVRPLGGIFGGVFGRRGGWDD